MHYVKQLQQENEKLQKDLYDTLTRINNFRTKLRGEKFRIDTTIQVGDVQSQLDYIVNGNTFIY